MFCCEGCLLTPLLLITTELVLQNSLAPFHFHIIPSTFGGICSSQNAQALVASKSETAIHIELNHKGISLCLTT